MKVQVTINRKGSVEVHDADTIPTNHRDCTSIVFGSPYSRVRLDDAGLYILEYGRRTPVSVTFR